MKERFTLVMLGASGGSKQLRVSTLSLVSVATLALSALCSALWLGWTIGELTARL